MAVLIAANERRAGSLGRAVITATLPAGASRRVTGTHAVSRAVTPSDAARVAGTARHIHSAAWLAVVEPTERAVGTAATAADRAGATAIIDRAAGE